MSFPYLQASFPLVVSILALIDQLLEPSPKWPISSSLGVDVTRSCPVLDHASLALRKMLQHFHQFDRNS
jgi:hypothetical protein